MADNKVIRQIKACDGIVYDIHALTADNAAKLGGYTFEQIESMVHGAIETYVIPSSKSSVSGYEGIINATGNTVTTTKTVLDNLTGGQANGGYKLGDVILMEATSDGKKVFDRWVSDVDGEDITLAVLETQVATHHHKVNMLTGVSRTITSSNAFTGATPTTTTSNMAYAGTAKTVLTGEAGEVITSVSHDNNGKYDLAVSTTSTSANAVGHAHTVKAHNHSVKFTPSSLVSKNVSVISSLTPLDYTPHKHTTIVSAAGTPKSETTITYVTGPSATDTFIKTLKDSSLSTGGATADTNANTSGLTTSTQVSTDSVGDIVKTTEAGSHTHSLSSAQTDTVVTSVTVADKAITGVTLTNNTSVAANVVTSITKSSKTVVSQVSLTGQTTFVDSWTCSVDGDGVLSFTVATDTVGVSVKTSSISAVGTITSTTQSAAAPGVTLTSVAQSVSTGKVAVSGTIASGGAHKHGFSHTHAIPSHTHTVKSHTHTYVKSVSDSTAAAITALSTSSHSNHSHNTSVSAAGAHTDDSKITYITSGTSISVVQNLKDGDFSCTVGDSSPETTTTYQKITGEITFPGFTLGTRTLSTTTIVPAVDSNEKPIKSVSYSSSKFLTGVTITTSSGDVKTSTNIGGE